MKWIRENIDDLPSFVPYLEKIQVIEDSVKSNPDLCIETCKALIEGFCKTILHNKDISYDPSSPLQGLVRQTIQAILHVDEPFQDDLIELGRRISSVSQKLCEIRNNHGFSSHGMDVLNPRLTETVSLFAYRITDTVGGFILNCYINNRIFTADHRLHYEDCRPFNEYFDDLHSLDSMSISISVSLALFTQDYEAYKESYFNFIESIEQDNP